MKENERTFHDTANRGLSLCFTSTVFDGHAGAGMTLPAISSPESPSVSAPPPTALRATSISNWLSASLRHFHHDFARASLRRVPLTASGRRLHDSGARRLVASLGRPDFDTWSSDVAGICGPVDLTLLGIRGLQFW